MPCAINPDPDQTGLSLTAPGAQMRSGPGRVRRCRARYPGSIGAANRAFKDFWSRARCLAVALGLALLLIWTPKGPTRAQEAVELTLDQARLLAVEALKAGDPGLAIQVARGLLLANPQDPFAHYVIATAHANLNQPGPGRAAAAKAYRYSDTGPDKYRAAQLAARLAYQEQRPTLAQIWLRRTAIHAPNETDLELVGRDYKVLRAQNPWALRIRTDLRPSSNVNNGADTALQIIDGVPVAGVLGPTAQALSGIIGSLDLAATYRLRASQTSATSLGGRLYIERVALSSDAQAQAPLARNSMFGSTFAELSLRHGFLAGAPGKGGAGFVDLAIGESWYGEARSYRFGRLSLDRTWRLQNETTVRMNGLVEDRFDARYRSNGATILGLNAEFNRRLGNGDLLALSLALRDTDSVSANGTFQAASFRAAYSFDQPVGPVRLSAGLTLGYSDYPVYQSGLFLVPGGRQDQSYYADVNMFFDQIDYAGFAPMLRIRAGRRRSNDSRFNSREVSVSLGIQSKF